VHSLARIARNEAIGKRYVERLSRLAFVSAEIVEAICQGQQPPELNAETLLNRIDLPLEWPAHFNALGIR
jgi:site-specific DNA recombinase